MRRIGVLFLLLAGCSKEPAVPPRPAQPPAPPVSEVPAPPPAAPTEAAVEKTNVIAHGDRYSPRDYLVPGYVTVLKFYADW